MIEANTACPCQSGKNYGECCQPLHLQQQTAATPEALMRSRYSAFVVKNAEYLQASHHVNTRSGDSNNDNASNNLALQHTFTTTHWQGLRIITSSEANTGEGLVEFIAGFTDNGQFGVLHERSRFVNDTGHWQYIDGDILHSGPTPLPGRNEACWCGSGKKLKKCHG